jgi:hypothetical protein
MSIQRVGDGNNVWVAVAASDHKSCYVEGRMRVTSFVLGHCLSMTYIKTVFVLSADCTERSLQRLSTSPNSCHDPVAEFLCKGSDVEFGRSISIELTAKNALRVLSGNCSTNEEAGFVFVSTGGEACPTVLVTLT